MERYVQLKDGIQDKGKLVEIKELDKVVANLDRNRDWYVSLFYYGKDALDYFTNNNNSIAAYKGTTLTNKITFDLDCKENPDRARIDACSLLSKLESEGVDINKSVATYFSGNKGFHIELLTNEEITPKQLKLFCQNFSVGLSTFDPSIYNTTRPFRAAFTRNEKSGLFKIYINPTQLKNITIDEIKREAKKCDPKNIQLEPFEARELLDKYTNKVSFSVTVDDSIEEIDGIRGLDIIDFKQCPKNTPRCIYALSKGVMVPGRGERDHLFLRLAAFYRNQGAHKEVVYNILKGVARLNHKLYPEAEQHEKERLWNTVNSVFDGGGQYKMIPGAIGTSADYEPIKRYCEAIKSECKCVLHNNNGEAKSVIQIDEVSNTFRNFAENLETNIVNTGINLIDKYMKLTVGTTSLLVGATGSSKTSLVLNIMENANRLDQHTMLFSLDMHKNLVYLKLAQKLTNYTQDQIMKFYSTKNAEKIEEIRLTIKKAYDKTFFDFSTTLTMEQMRDRVTQTEEKSGVKIKLVVVDYASRIAGPYSDKHANATYNALKSTEVADQTDAHWMFIAQIARATGDGSTPLRSKRVAKESGDWEESASGVITIWRPFMGIEGHDNFLRLFLAKNRMGAEIERPLFWDGAKSTIYDMDDYQLAEYQKEWEPKEKELQKSKRMGSILQF